MKATSPVDAGKRRTTLLLAGLAVGMFAFGFALVPLYNLICQATGLQSVAVRSNGGPGAVRTGGTVVDNTREVVVKFDTSVHPNLPWEFAATQQRLQVVPGQMYEVIFKARNRSSSQVVGQAIPSIVPWQATPYFNKLECFCFNRQLLEGGESTDMPLRFVVSPDLPEGINSLTLAYSFLKLDEDAAPNRTNAISSATAVKSATPKGKSDVSTGT
ncbi:MAG: cytochrome c oxidase assembly protein [Gammaproteobacteria bacterium]|nr:cytochrome c oxidase assembly protein [Gammaproteobacteria bacterium]MCP5416228.1 cytochrome c oxidase assembly protein [Chromatiaceae bacterium]